MNDTSSLQQQLTELLANAPLNEAVRDELKNDLTEATEQTSPPSPSIVSGRDTHITNNFEIALNTAEVETQRSRFLVELDADEVASTKFNPRRLQQILDIVKAQRVVILGVERDVPAPALLRDIALWLREELATDTSNAPIKTILVNTPVAIKDGEVEKVLFDLESELSNFGEAAIVALSSISRQHLDWDLDLLQHKVKDPPNHYYIIASTEIPMTLWRLLEREQKYWHPITSEGLYSIDFLEEFLEQQLIEHHDNFPKGINYLVTSTQSMIGALSLLDVAHRLRTEVNIIAFVQLLCSKADGMEPNDLDTLITEVAQQDVNKTIRKWFIQGLSRREQLMVVGLSLLDGLQESQVFPALEELMANIWRDETSAYVIDHIDMESLTGFFSFREIASYQTQLQSQLPGQRRSLLDISLSIYGRHMRMAVEWLAELVQGSVVPHASSSPLYATPSQRAQLRTVISETLSDTGLISVDAVQPALLSLVAHHRDDMHVLVARTVARWHSLGETERIFSLLRRWQREKRTTGIVRSFVKQRFTDLHEAPESLLNATIVLILTYAARYDKPGEMTPTFLDMLMTFAENMSPRTLRYFRDYTLPMLIPLHLSQLDTLLGALTYYAELRQALTQQLARAYEKDPAGVKKIIRTWYIQGMRDCPPYTAGAERTRAETTLTTLVLTLSELPYDLQHRDISLEAAVHTEREIYKKSANPLIRQAVWSACIRQMHQDNPILHQILSDITEDEYQQVVTLLVEAFLEQRAALTGNEEDVTEMATIKGRQYCVWLDRDAPKTVIENTLEQWIIQTDDSIARKIVLLASMSITRQFYCEEKTCIEERLNERRKQALIQQQATEQQVNHEQALPIPVQSEGWWSRYYIAEFVPLLTTLDNSHCRTIVRDLLPTALQLAKIDKRALTFLLEKWKLNRHSDISDIAYCLENAVTLVEQGWRGPLTAGIVSIIRALYTLISDGMHSRGFPHSSNTSP